MSKIIEIHEYLFKKLDGLNAGWDSLGVETVQVNQAKSLTYKEIIKEIEAKNPDENFKRRLPSKEIL